MKTLRILLAVVTVLLLRYIEAKNIVCNSGSKPNFTAVGRRISEQKCLEYNWERKNIRKCDMEPAHIDHPYMGMMGYKIDGKEGWLFLCSACLISPKFGLTTGRCVKRSREPYFSGPHIVRFGNKDIRSEVPRVDAEVLRGIPFADWDEPGPEIDIGLVELREALVLTRSIQPACLWSKPDLGAVVHGVAPGWPSTNIRVESTDLMSERHLQLLDSNTCEEYQKNNSQDAIKLIFEDNWCTTGTPDKMCRGTAGNPLITLAKVEGEDQMPYALGMASFVMDCSGGSTRLFNKVFMFLDWIEQTVWSNSDAV